MYLCGGFGGEAVVSPIFSVVRVLTFIPIHVRNPRQLNP